MGPTTVARIVLFSLQVFTTVLALLSSTQPWSWLGWLCATGVGPCNCDTDHLCWTNQMVYRVELAGFVVFSLYAALAVGGCVLGAQESIPGFLVVPVLSMFFILVPNSIFEYYGSFSVAASVVFLIVQTVLMVDFGMVCNDRIFGTGGGDRTAKIVLVSISSVFLLGALALAICLFLGWGFFEGGWLVALSLFLSLALLVCSITDWCEQGNLFCSSLVTAYSVWLAYEALITQTSRDPYSSPDFAKWVGLIIASITLVASMFGSGLGVGVGDAREGILEESSGGDVNKKVFGIQASVHAFATLYVTTVLAPTQSTVGFVFHVLGLFGSLLIYGWILIAPKVLSNRGF